LAAARTEPSRSRAVIELRARCIIDLALVVIGPRRRAVGIGSLAQARAAPQMEGGCRAARDRRRDRGAAAQAVIAEARLLAWLRRIGDRGEAVLGVPEVIALPVGEEIAIGVVAERLAGEARQLVDIVVGGRLAGRRRTLNSAALPPAFEDVEGGGAARARGLSTVRIWGFCHLLADHFDELLGSVRRDQHIPENTASPPHQNIPPGERTVHQT
jgi:hypothetical protein